MLEPNLQSCIYQQNQPQMCAYCVMSRWDEIAFQARIMGRAQSLGINTPREVMRSAGVSENTFDKKPGQQGRTYNTIHAIARAVGWTVAEAIGQGWSEDLLAQSIEVSFRAVGPRDRDTLSAAILSGYDVLSALSSQGRPIDGAVLSTLEASLRRRHSR